MNIDKCRSCQSVDVTDLLSLGDQYLSDFREDDQLPPKYPLDLVICQDCMLVQLKETTPSHELYTDNYGYESGINESIKADLNSIVANAIAIYRGKDKDLDDKVVVDIGANDGTLLSNYAYFGYHPQKLGIDPVPKFKEKLKRHADYAHTDFFKHGIFESIFPDRKASIITSISMFYDLDDPNTFVSDVKDILADDGIWVVQQNYLGTMLSQTAYCNICHEHVEYYSLYSFEKLLNKFDLKVFKVGQSNINGGSFRAFICHKDTYVEEDSVQEMRDSEISQGLDRIEVYKEFADRIELRANELHDLIEDLVEQGKTVYVYGASTRGNTLLQASRLNNHLLPFAVERNPGKWGKKIASLQIPIIKEEEAREHQPDYMLVLPWFFFSEFAQREADYLENGGSFILPLPEVRIVTKDSID